MISEQRKSKKLYVEFASWLKSNVNRSETTESNVGTCIDEADIARFRLSSDSSDLNELVGRHIGNVHSTAWKMTGNQAAADDVTQEVFLKVFSALTSFKGESTFATWLYRITLNTIYTWCEKAKKTGLRMKQVDELDGHESTNISNTRNSPDRALLHSELEKAIDSEIQKLKPELRAAIVLTTIEDLSPGEAAKIVDCSPETFYWRLNQARKQLEQKLSRYLEP